MTHVGDGYLDTMTGTARGWQTQSTFLEDGYTWTAYTERGSESGTAPNGAEASRLAQEAYDRLIRGAA